MTEDIAQSLGLKEVQRRHRRLGAKGQRGRARRACRQGDVITALNGPPVGDANELRNLVAAHAAGTDVTLDHPARRPRAAAQRAARRSARPSRSGPRRQRRRSGRRLDRQGWPSRCDPLHAGDSHSSWSAVGTQGLVSSRSIRQARRPTRACRSGDVIEQVNRQPVRSTDESAARASNAPARGHSCSSSTGAARPSSSPSARGRRNDERGTMNDELKKESWQFTFFVPRSSFSSFRLSPLTSYTEPTPELVFRRSAPGPKVRRARARERCQLTSYSRNAAAAPPRRRPRALPPSCSVRDWTALGAESFWARRGERLGFSGRVPRVSRRPARRRRPRTCPPPAPAATAAAPR